MHRWYMHVAILKVAAFAYLTVIFVGDNRFHSFILRNGLYVRTHIIFTIYMDKLARSMTQGIHYSLYCVCVCVCVCVFVC